MAGKQHSTKAKVHPDLGTLDLGVTDFGEVAGDLDIDRINKFLDRNVIDKKLIQPKPAL